MTTITEFSTCKKVKLTALKQSEGKYLVKHYKLAVLPDSYILHDQLIILANDPQEAFNEYYSCLLLRTYFGKK